MERRLVVWLLVVCSLLAGIGVGVSFFRHHRAFNEDSPRPKLVIYTYSTFKDALGPGPELIEKFKEECLCDIEVVDAGAGRVLLEKVKLAQDQQIDFVLGLDQLTLKAAAQQVRWRRLTFADVKWDEGLTKSIYPTFLPYDWSPLTFVYREGELSPYENLREWARYLPENALALQDPALSSPGLQFVYWIFSVTSADDFNQFFNTLKPKIHSISAKWSDSYSVFQSGHARAVFTYLTSLVYHWQEEPDGSFKVAEFTDGHPQQIEYMAIPEQCVSCGIAESFANFLLKPETQKILMEKNYMLPAVKGVVDGTEFAKLPKLKLIEPAKLEEFVDRQREIVGRWESLVK